MKRKYSIITVLLLFVIVMTNCSLDEKIYDQPASDSFINTKGDIAIVVNGLYATLTSNVGYRNAALPLIMISGDDLPSVNATWGSISIKSYTPTTTQIQNFWTGVFTTINNANDLIAKVPEVNAPDDYKNRIMGELYFIRAFSYFNAVRLWGKLPILTETTTGSSNFNTPRSPVDSVYALIFKDLKEASKRCLRASKMPTAEFGHATKGAADGILSLASLTYGNFCDLNNRTTEAQKYYKQAQEYADTVLLSNEYDLLPNFADLWNVDKEKAAYKEVIFGIQFMRDETRSLGSIFAALYAPNTLYGSAGILPNRIGTGNIRVNPWFYDKCTTGDYAGDYRGECTFLTKWIYNGSSANPPQYMITYPLSRTAKSTNPDLTSFVFPLVKKYFDGKANISQGGENDWFYLRLAEIYLIKAEAENEINGPNSVAYEAFNKIRERARKANGTVRNVPANLTAGLSKENFRLAVFNERSFELLGEGHRFFDLQRMRYIDNTKTMMEYQYAIFIKSLYDANPTPPKYNTTTESWDGGRLEPQTYALWNSRFLLLPIPQNEMNTNSSLVGDQNPGWQ
jgi:hypothetical protein